MARETWQSRLGFMFAAAGSAVGLANIWRFPYVVGSSGGAAFVILYLVCLALIGIPVFVAEVLIGRHTQASPSAAFQKLAPRAPKLWGIFGKGTILTGFIVSSFYSVVAGWILGYLVQAFAGNLTSFTSGSEAAQHYQTLIANPAWVLGYHALFICLCGGLLFFGVQHGIERGSKIMMPLLFILLIGLAVRGLMLPGAWKGVEFLISPNWHEVTPTVVIVALGQAFFTLSLGQGTMVTYGSYLRRGDNILGSCLPVILMDTVVSLLAAVAVMTIVFSAGLAPTAGESLLFETLPIVFSSTPGGYLFGVGFFLLVTLAAVTSEISAMEPAIAYLMEKKLSRHLATACVTLGGFLLGIPCALSFSYFSGYTFLGETFFGAVAFVATAIMIPLGGFAAVVLVGWGWGPRRAIESLRTGAEELFNRRPWIGAYFSFCFKYVAPTLIALVFIHALGLV